MAPRFDAFISYNHAADGDLAPAIETGLERIAKPWYRLRGMSVVRDLSDTGATSDLPGTVERQLDASAFLILLASRGSAGSKWVEREATYWCETRGAESVIVVLTDGVLAWDHDAGRFMPSSNALAPTVAARFAKEPAFVDMTWTQQSPDLTLRNPLFREHIARIASPIKGMAPADIESEDIRLHRRAKRLARTAVAVVVTLAIVASVAAVLAVANARRAERRAREAVARQIGLAALDLPPGELDEALLLSAAAIDLDPSNSVDQFRTSRTLLGRHDRLMAMLHLGTTDDSSVRSVAISPDGTTVAATVDTLAAPPEVLTWTLGAPATPRRVPLMEGNGTDLAFVGDGAASAVLTAAGVGRGLSTIATGATTATEVDGRVVDVDAWSDAALVATDGAMHLVDTRSGEDVAEWPITDAIGDVDDARAAVLTVDGIVLADAATGEVLARADEVGVARPTALAIGGDGVVVAASETGTLTVWRRDGTQLVVDGPSTAIAAAPTDRIAVSDDGSTVLIVGADGSTVVDLDDGTRAAPDAAAGTIAPDPTGRYVAVGGSRLTIWDLVTGQRAVAVSETVNTMAWSACDDDDPCRLVTAGEAVDVWEPRTGRRTRLAEQTNAQAVAITPDGDTVVTGGWGSAIAVWDLTVPVDDAGRERITADGALAAADPATGAVAVAGDGEVKVTLADGSHRTIATGALDALHLLADATRLLAVHEGVPRLFVVDTGAEVPLDPRCGGDLIAPSATGRRLVGHRVSDGRTVVCDTDDGSITAGALIAGVAAPADVVAVDDSGNVALGGNGYVEQHVVQGTSFAPVGEAVDTRFGTEPARVRSLAFHDGVVAAGIRPTSTRGETSRVLVWDAEAGGAPVAFDTDHLDVPVVALLGAHADLLVIGGSAGDGGDVVLQVWETGTRRRLGRGLGGLRGDVISLGGDERTVVGTDAGGQTFRWSLDVDPRGRICAIVGRPLTEEEWNTAAGGALDHYDYSPVC